MIAAVRVVPFNAPALVDPSSTVKGDGVLAVSYSLSYPWISKCAIPRIQGQKIATLVQCSADLRLKPYGGWPSLQCHKIRSSSFGSEHLAGFKHNRNSSCRSRKEPDIRCDSCRDDHQHDSHDEEEYCRPPPRKKEESNFKHTKPPKDCSKPQKECPKPQKEGSDADDANQGCVIERPGGYTIRVSKELMGVFRYVEKVKRARTKDLAHTLRKVSQATFLFSCVRGVLAPLLEVYRTSPPNWKSLIYMIGTFDSFALSYLAMKASEPLLQLSMLATETDSDMMVSIKKEEEHMLALAIELVKLFRRLRNVALLTALTQLVQVTIQLRDPAFSSNVAKIFGSWFECPWGGS